MNEDQRKLFSALPTSLPEAQRRALVYWILAQGTQITVSADGFSIARARKPDQTRQQGPIPAQQQQGNGNGANRTRVTSDKESTSPSTFARLRTAFEPRRTSTMGWFATYADRIWSWGSGALILGLLLCMSLMSPLPARVLSIAITLMWVAGAALYFPESTRNLGIKTFKITVFMTSAALCFLLGWMPILLVVLAIAIIVIRKKRANAQDN